MLRHVSHSAWVFDLLCCSMRRQLPGLNDGVESSAFRRVTVPKRHTVGVVVASRNAPKSKSRVNRPAFVCVARL